MASDLQMNDKTLLELAAKAAGIAAHTFIDGSFLHILHGQIVARWNPLDDDGDALRLAVKLGLSIEILSTRMEPHTRVNGKEEEHRADPYAATRRAIVRAAAEIGKSA